MRDYPGQFGSLKVFFVLLFLGVLAYGQTIHYPFVHDDVLFIQNNPRVADLDLREVFLTAPGRQPEIVNIYYRPFLELIYRVQYKFFRFNPAGYHGFNILIHILNSFMLYKLMEFLLKGNRGLSFSAALLFLLHPVQTEAVACIAGVSNLLFAFFCLLSFYLYCAALRQGKMGWYGLSLIFFFIGLMAKEQAVILPFLILLSEHCFSPARKNDWASRMRRAGGYFFVLTGYFILRRFLLGGSAVPSVKLDGELWLRVLSIPGTLLTYLGIIIFPHDLHYYRSADILRPFIFPFSAFFAVGAMVTFAVRRVPRPYPKRLLWGAGWFCIALLPVLNIIPLVNEYSLILTAEHFLYIPVIGVILFVLGMGHFLLGKFFPRRRQIFSISIMGTIGLVFLVMTVKQNTYWSGEIPLFERTVRFEKEFGRGHILLAKAYQFDGRHHQAIKAYQKALGIMRGYARKAGKESARRIYLGYMKGIYFDMAHCFEGLGDFRNAADLYNQALELDPGDGVIHNNAGVSYMNLGQMEAAAGHFKRAIELNKDDLMAMNNLAGCYLHMGKKEDARQILERILLKDPQSRSARTNLMKLSPPLQGAIPPD